MKYLTFILVLVLSFIVCKQYDEINNLTIRLNHLDYKVDNINKNKFQTAIINDKESFYLTQLSNSTTLILSVIGFSLVLAGISSFLIIKERFEIFDASTKQKIVNISRELELFRDSNSNIIDTHKAEINNQIHKYETDYENIKHNIYGLKNDLSYELITIKYNEGKDAFSKQDLYGYIFYTLLSLKYSVDCSNYYKSIGSNLSDSIIDIMNNRLFSMKLDLESLLKYDNIQKHSLFKKDKESIINLIKNINTLNNDKTFELLSSIFNTLSFDK